MIRDNIVLYCRSIFVICLFFFISGCVYQYHGLLNPSNEFQENIILPESAVAGEFVTVTVITLGDNCTKMGPTEVEVVGLIATIEVYDYYDNIYGIYSCTENLVPYFHQATFKFDEVGYASVNVKVRQNNILPAYFGPATIKHVLIVN